MQLRIELKQEAEGRWIAEIPALPGVKTYGVNRAEVLTKVQALALRFLAERHQDGEAEPELLSVSFHVVKEYQLGILLVHGIGTQPSGETLVHWGDVLLRTIGHATRPRVAAIVGSAGPNLKGDSEDCAEAVIQLQADNHEERWLLSEGWWADAFHAPSFYELVVWSLRALPWSIALHFAQRYWHASERDGPLANVTPVVIATTQLLVALVFAPLFLLLLTLTLILGLLPIPQLRTLILKAQGTLAATVGDSLAFVESPVRAALIRTRILNGLKRLEQRCEHTILIAHSQGAAVVLDALGGILGSSNKDDQASLQDVPAPDVVPDTLVTFGAGTNQLASLKVLSAGLPGKNPTFFAIVALVITAALSTWLYKYILAEPDHFWKVLQAVGLQFLFIIVLSFVAWYVPRLITVLSKRRPTLQKHVDNIPVWSIVLLMGAALVPLLYYVEREDLPIISVNLFFMALIAVWGGISMILSNEMKTNVTTVRKPPGLRKWIDIYASADPVPNGPTRTSKNDEKESIPIWNLGSTFADHTAYWNNLDGFVLRIVKACAETAKSPWQTQLPPVTPGDKRSSWRVRCLRLVRWAIVASWLLVGISLWKQYREKIMEMPLPFKPPDWLLPSIAETTYEYAVLAALIALVSWACFGILRLLWQPWVHAEQKAVLAHQKTGGTEFLPLFGMSMIVWLILFLALFVVTPSITGFWGWVSVIVPSAISAWVLLKLRPATEEATANPPTSAGKPDS